MRRGVILEIIIYLFVFLFVYTALSKLFIYDVYIKDLRRSPELTPFALALSFIIPVTELLIAAILIIKRTKLLGLYGALLLMILFTIYVSYVLKFYDSYPCQCGGIIKELTWRQHLIFNIVFTLLAGLGVVLQTKDKNNNKLQIDGTISYA